MILFDTKPDIAAFVETNLKIQEKIAASGYTWVGKNRQHKEGGGVGCFIKNTIKNYCTVEPDNNRTTEILSIQLKLKRQENFFVGVLYGKQESKHCIKELEEEYDVIEKSISNYTKTNNKIISVGDFDGKIGNDENGITNGDTSFTTNGRRVRSMVRTLNLDILNKHAKCEGKWTRVNTYQKQ